MKVWPVSALLNRRPRAGAGGEGLIHEFPIRTAQTRVKDEDGEEIATQIIGIDPASSKLKSWTFESDGSIGTADWVRTETAWVASVSATSADGDPVKAVTTIKPASRNEFTFQMTERTVDGEKAPDTKPVKVTRVTKNP